MAQQYIEVLIFIFINLLIFFANQY